jgi:hypothetical protein
LFYKRNRTRDPCVPEPKRSSLAIFNESTTFERVTKESRNMSAATKEPSDKRAPRQKSAATKERRDKRAPRQNSVRQINTVTRQDFEKAAVNVFTEEVAFSIFRRQFIGMSNLQDSKHLMLQILNLHSCCATCQHWHLCQYKMYRIIW